MYQEQGRKESSSLILVVDETTLESMDLLYANDSNHKDGPGSGVAVRNASMTPSLRPAVIAALEGVGVGYNRPRIPREMIECRYCVHSWIRFCWRKRLKLIVGARLARSKH